MDIKHRILLQAFHLFLRYGIRNVSMDEIARELGISKKTIYQYFEDKAAIVLAVSQMQHEEECKVFEKITQESSDAIEELWGVMLHINKTFMQIPPLVIYEIQKYYPEAWQVHRNANESMHLGSIMRNLQLGVEQGFYRKEIDIEMTARLRLSMIDSAMESAWFPRDRYSLKDVHVEAFYLFIYGILTEKGRAKALEIKQAQPL